MNLYPALDAVVADLIPRFPDLTVGTHGGAFTERELALWLGTVPCLRVGCLGLNRIAPRGGRGAWQADLRWAAYILTADRGANGRLQLALDTVDTLISYLMTGPRWGLNGSAPTLDSIQAENLYTGPVNVLNVALWAVAWTQTHHFVGVSS